MGTPDFAAASLKKLIDEKRDVVGVFTQPDKPKGRGMELAASPVKVLALENGIPVYQPVKMRDGKLASWRMRSASTFARMSSATFNSMSPRGGAPSGVSVLPKSIKTWRSPPSSAASSAA